MKRKWFFHKYREAGLTSGGNTVAILSNQKTVETLANGEEYELAGGSETYVVALFKGDVTGKLTKGELVIETDRVPRDIVNENGEVYDIQRLM